MLALALSVPTPRSALSALAGAAAGFSAGLGLVLVGGLLGALFGFGISRWLGRAAVARLISSRWPRVDRFLTHRAFSTVLVARLLPAPPFAVVSYAAGASGVRLAPYLLGTAVGMLPGSLLYVSLGASASGFDAWTRDLGGWAWTLIGLAVAVTGSAVWWGRRHLSRRPPSRMAAAGTPEGKSP
ncbi:TVP38/TMEM64 family protein [Modestobacter altitudinis]|uniref:TVP38/TMEM64 family protein n=1 Tax=Modestobacter altitudinis TaxID=2213158 RepID=UPI0034E06F9F